MLQAGIFAPDVSRSAWSRRGPLLTIENPLWVTNAELGRLARPNAPSKAHQAGLTGLDAITRAYEATTAVDANAGTLAP